MHVDWARLNSFIAEGDEEEMQWLREMIQTLIINYEERLVELDEIIKNPDNAKLIALLHQMKGVTSNFGLETAEIKDEFTAKGLKAASQKLDILKLEPADRKEYDRYMEGQRSDASFVETVKLEITTAVSEALKNSKEEIAENALREGASVEFVVKITVLSIEEVRSIIERLGLNK